jgi:hypothetical protein
LAAHNPSLSVASLKATLINTVDQIPNFNNFYRSGRRLNVFAALSNPTVCTIAPAQTSMTVPTKGGVFSIPVSTLSNCDYSVTSSSNWVKIESPAAASGSGTVSFRVGVNPTITRSATINIGGQQVTILQSRTGNN